MENVDNQKILETKKTCCDDDSWSNEIFTSLHSKLNNP